MLGDLVHIDGGHLLHFRRHLVRVGCDELGHVFDVCLGADGGFRPVLVDQIVVAPDHLMIFLHAPGPEVALQLAGLGVHEGFGQSFGVAVMALAAGLVGDADGAGIGIEGVRPAGIDEIRRRVRVRRRRSCGAGRAAMTDDATAGIVEVDTHGLDLLDHGAIGEALNAFVAG